MHALRTDTVDFAAAHGVDCTTSDALSPRSGHPPPSSTSSSSSSLELPGAASARTPARITRHARGVVHLYRSSPAYADYFLAAVTSSGMMATPPPPPDPLLPPWRGKCLLVLAVPSRVSPDDFLRLCGPHVDRASDIRVIRGDGVEDRYSVLLTFADHESADGFYRGRNGWRFPSTKGEVCHVLFVAALEYTPSAEIASTPPPESTELPTCPVCIERLD